jgi:hypothetical protein
VFNIDLDLDYYTCPVPLLIEGTVRQWIIEGLSVLKFGLERAP